MTRAFLPALSTLAALAVAAPAAAQDDAGDRVNMVIVYGEDACPPSQGDEIVVCARMDESERYRIPPKLRFSDDAANTAWARKVEALETVGQFGINSCSPVGAGGITGCTQQMIDAAYADRRDGSDARFGQLIEEARQERLSTIDESAAAEQKRVEQIEQDYMARLKKERDAEVPAQTTDPDSPPRVDPAARTPPAPPSRDTSQSDDGGETARPIDATPPTDPEPRG